MTDELTPQEKEALKNLPRERMPVGLEARVVHAMRDHGFLAKRRRTIELTGSRVAGVLAAGVAVVIGAYSIGLHRGGGEVPVPVAALERAPDEVRAPSQVTPEVAGKAEEPAVADAAKKGIAEPKANEFAAPAAPAARLEEAPADRGDQAASREVDVLASEQLESIPVPTGAAPEPLAASKAGRMRPASPRSETAFAPSRSLTFLLDGSLLTVEADSVRVIEDERGRMFIIYTQTGIVRIRSAD